MDKLFEKDWKKYEYYCIDEHRKEFPNFKTEIWNNVAENDLADSGYIDYLFDRKLNPSIMRKNRKDTINQYCEYGLDGLARYKDNFHLLQVKYYKPTHTIGMSSLKTFVEIHENLDCSSYLYHIGKVYKDFKIIENMNFRSPEMNSEYSIDEVDVKKEYDVIDESCLWDHQVDILKLMRNILKENKFNPMRSLELCPGGGKTDLTGVFIREVIDKFVIVFNYQIAFVEQNHGRLGMYVEMEGRVHYNINSESSCTIERILEKTGEFDKALINITYDSLHLIKDVREFDNSFFIVDESHRMTNDLIEYLRDKRGYCMTGTCVKKVVDIFPEFYSLSLSEAIERKIVTDYKIYLPLIEKIEDIGDRIDDDEEEDVIDDDKLFVDKVDFLLTGMLKTGARFNITYFNKKQECLEFKRILEERAGSDTYNVLVNCKIVVDDVCSGDRLRIFNSFRKKKDDENKIVLNIILNCHILDMAIDIKLCDSIYFTQKSKIKNITTFIQRICRGNRLDNGNKNKFTRVFIYGDDGCIGNLVDLNNYDDKFVDKVEKIRGDYTKGGREVRKLEIDGTVDFKRRIVDVIEYGKEGVVERWYKNLEDNKAYIRKWKKRPPIESDDTTTAALGRWLSLQNMNIKERINCMKNEEIYQAYIGFITDPEFENYFLSNKEAWFKSLEDNKAYIRKWKKKPNPRNVDKNSKILSHWLSSQLQKSKDERIQIMKDEEIYQAWISFINDIEFREYFLTNNEIWYKNLEDVKVYVRLWKKRPLRKEENADVKILNRWIGTQAANYKEKMHIMENEEIYQAWNSFINEPEFRKYFLSNKELWYKNLEDVKTYITNEKTDPSRYDTDDEVKILGNWLASQKQNAKGERKQILKNEEMYKDWCEFISDPEFRKYFLTAKEIWYKNLEDVKTYIIKEDDCPSRYSVDDNIKMLGNWIRTQTANFKGEKTKRMKDDDKYQAWISFITDPVYKKHFLNREETWYRSLEDVKKYIIAEGRKPPQKHNDDSIVTLNRWINTQVISYRDTIYIMKDSEKINQAWYTFVNDPKFTEHFK